MSDTDPSREETPRVGLTAADLMRQRDESATQLVRALLIVNAGGSAALLAFLQAIWVSSRELAKPTVIGMLLLAFGAFARKQVVDSIRQDGLW